MLIIRDIRQNTEEEEKERLIIIQEKE